MFSRRRLLGILEGTFMDRAEGRQRKHRGIEADRGII